MPSARRVLIVASLMFFFIRFLYQNPSPPAPGRSSPATWQQTYCLFQVPCSPFRGAAVASMLSKCGRPLRQQIRWEVFYLPEACCKSQAASVFVGNFTGNFVGFRAILERICDKVLQQLLFASL